MIQVSFWQRAFGLLLAIALGWSSFCGVAGASLTDDRFDGNIFALYAGNGSLVPPKVTLAQALERDKPTLLVLYINDSRDCKQFSTVVSQLQSFYGRAADFIPIDVDSLPVNETFSHRDPGYYYRGLVPQTILLDATGNERLNVAGAVGFEVIDDAFREVFNLLPRSQSLDLKPRPLNEINTEFVSPT